jgi:hypothetical protein
MPDPILTARLSAIALCVAATVGAQTLPRAAFAPYLPDARTDSLLVVVELRDLAAIEFDRDVADRKRVAAGQREAAARTFQSRAAMSIEIKDTEITALKARVKQAKVERDGTLTEQFENERKHAEFEKQLLRRREQLRQSDIRFAKAEFEYHDAAFKAYGHELDLARMRANRNDVEQNIPSRERFEKAWQLDRQIRELEGRTLDALREASQKQKSLAEQAVKIFQARKKVWEAQRDLLDSAAGSP